ncbi:hypothetical protein BGZ95_007330 [Linnemannia exigua]|uniref:NADH dehydrogenase [ubiquinone] 1 beta subcomplex subunit 9 n=1 Tax=Linnemannia exigua TaxID=604196 RepID=A0AAD4DFD5_9FUNG|nr:hypothetical protein BGZ95_007330 [Linnemannia exigua]
MSEAAQLVHRRLVQSLYKRSLKTAQDWYIDTNLFRRKAVELRMQFDANRNVRHPRQLASIVQEAERQLKELRHPDPYIGMLQVAGFMSMAETPTAVGGTKFERNIHPDTAEPHAAH